jgi:two-component system OmpR family response regulator
MKRKVLIVDDEIDLCMLMKGYLGKMNYDVYTAHTLTDGFDKLNTIQPDVLFLDNNLPDGTGWGQAHNIHTRFPNMHINLMSALSAIKSSLPTAAIPFRILEKPVKLADMDKYL